MISNIHNRAAYWVDTIGQIHFDYNRIPDECLMSLDGKTVLEVGPGNGRHTSAILKRCKTYSVADISQTILDTFKEMDDVLRYRLDDYSDEFGKFDAIVGWYVFHHIKYDELEDFIQFLKRNLTPGGMILFNTPAQFGPYQPEAFGDDGMLTVKRDAGLVVAELKKAGFGMVYEDEQSCDSYVIEAKLKTGQGSSIPSVKKTSTVTQIPAKAPVKKITKIEKQD